MKVSKKDLETLLKHMESDSTLYGNTAVAALKALYTEAEAKGRDSLNIDDTERYIATICWHTEDIQKELLKSGYKPTKKNVTEVENLLNWFDMRESAIKNGTEYIQEAIKTAVEFRKVR